MKTAEEIGKNSVYIVVVFFVFLIFNLTQISREKRVFFHKTIMRKFVRISAKNVFFSIFLKIPRKTGFVDFFVNSVKTGFF